MSKIAIPKNLKGKALYDFLVANKKELVAQKKAGIKYTDPFAHASIFMSGSKASAAKGASGTPMQTDSDSLHVKMTANTMWWFDSQRDVLTDTCADKSISERGTNIVHIKDHIWQSDSHVGDVTSVYTEKRTLKDLGLNMPGSTTVMVQESDIHKEYNPKVFLMYKNGKINQHSIGLLYVQIGLCINDKSYLPEYELYQKYYPKVINKADVDEYGYFWIVPEIKWMENSCVLFGANELTDTDSISEIEDSDDNESGKSTTRNPPAKKSFNFAAINK